MHGEQCIFVIDDSKAHRSLIKRALKKSGISQPVLEADSLTAARALFFPACPADPLILIVDLNLGDGKGTTLIRELRANESFELVPILVLSTSALETDIDESLQSGANAFITKATDLERLAKDICGAVSKLLGVNTP